MIKNMCKAFIFYVMCIACLAMFFVAVYMIFQFFQGWDFDYITGLFIAIIVFYCFYICVESFHEAYKDDLSSTAKLLFLFMKFFGRLVPVSFIEKLIKALD